MRATAAVPAACWLFGATYTSAFVLPARHALQGAEPGQEAEPVRVQVLSVTGIPGIEYASGVQDAVLATLGPRDRYANLCEPGCEAAAKGKLVNVIELQLREAFPGGVCTRAGQVCSGYQQAQMKFVYGLVTKVREGLDAGGPLPEWYLLKDDDTLVDVDGLVSQVCGYSSDEPISFGYPISCPGAKPGSFWIAGGRGWLVSRGLAKKLAVEHGQRWISLQAGVLNQSQTFCIMDPRGESGYTWDSQVPQVLEWVPEAKLYNSNDLGPDCTWHLGDWLVKLKAEQGRQYISGCRALACEAGSARRRDAGVATCAAAPGCPRPAP